MNMEKKCVYEKNFNYRLLCPRARMFGRTDNKKTKIIAKDSEKVLIDANDAEKVLIDVKGLYKVAELKQNGFTYWRL